MTIAFGGGVYAWNSAQIIVLFVVAGVLWATFTTQQALAIFTVKENRLVPISILRSWEMQILFAQIASAVTVVYVPMYFIPLYFQFVEGDSALHSAVRLLPFVFTNVFGIIFNGAIMGKLGYYMPWYLIGGMLSIAGGALFTAAVGVNTNPGAIYGYSVLCGLGSGLLVQASFAIAQSKVAPVSRLRTNYRYYAGTNHVTQHLPKPGHGSHCPDIAERTAWYGAAGRHWGGQLLLQHAGNRRQGQSTGRHRTEHQSSIPYGHRSRDALRSARVVHEERATFWAAVAIRKRGRKERFLITGVLRLILVFFKYRSVDWIRSLPSLC